MGETEALTSLPSSAHGSPGRCPGKVTLRGQPSASTVTVFFLKRAGGVAQGEVPEFKLQCHKKQKRKKI
jgi:hypothetical protein